MDGQRLTKGRELHGGLRDVLGPGCGAAGGMGGMVLLGVGYLEIDGRVGFSIRNTRKARMKTKKLNSEQIRFRFEYAKNMIDDMDSAESLYRNYSEGTVHLGVPMHTFCIPHELAIKADILRRMYMSFVADLIFSLGYSRKRLNNDDVYDFLRGYTGEIDSKAGNSRHEKFIRKTGAFIRKAHNNLINADKKEQAK